MHISRALYSYWANVGECGKPIRSTEAVVVGEGFVTTRCCQQRGLVPSPWGEGERGIGEGGHQIPGLMHPGLSSLGSP